MNLPPLRPLQRSEFPLTTPSGAPVQNYAQYIAQLDALIRAFTAQLDKLTNAANDAAAAAAGVPVGAPYRNGSILMVRVV